MRKRIVSIILYLCIIMGMASGCGTKEEEASVSPAAEKIPETRNASEKDSGNSDFAGDSDEEITDAETTNAAVLENLPDIVKALGMPLMDDTALLVLVRKCKSDDYKYIVDQYEYDREGRMLRHLAGYNTKYEYEYDADGNLLSETCYDADVYKNWELSYWVEYSYMKDEVGRPISRMERKYNADGSLSRESVYDSEDKLLKEKEISYVENVLHFEYEYDSSTHQAWKMQYVYDEQGNIAFRYRTEYDDAGNQTLYVVYDAEGNINVFEGYECDSYVRYYSYWSYENTYDDNGNLIQQVKYDYENNETERREYTYNENGDLASKFFSDEMVTREYVYEYEYNDDNNCIKKLETVYKYDDAGNLIEYLTETNKIWEREYDEENRLIKFTNHQDSSKRWYEYTYVTIGISDANYPYDKIKIR